ncbi:MAG: glycosyltransferase [Pirellulales bacterium]|nr:glycosyltransferase [Pirellulales bacterium]
MTTIMVIALTVALLETFLLGCQAWEHRRRARRRLASPPCAPPAGQIALIAPCKGCDLELRENLQSLFAQRNVDYQIAFVVEDVRDQAVPVIDDLIRRHRGVEATIVFAGRSRGACQKVHNLLAGVANLPPAVTTLAFVDSDARPGADWLRSLVQRLAQPGVGAATGYRWFLPRRPTLANYLLYSINATAASLYTPKSFQPIWGGSWAMRRDLFEQLDVAAAWRDKLTDDLVVTNVVQSAGLHVEFEPACMIASPVDMTPRETFAFLRRQYLIGRHYVRRWWTLALVAGVMSVAAFWGSLAIGLVALATGNAWGGATVGVAAAWYAINAAKAALRTDLAAMYFPRRFDEMSGATRCDPWLAPLSALVNWLAIVSTIGARRTTWRGIAYQLLPAGRTAILARDDETPVVLALQPAGAHAATCDESAESAVRPNAGTGRPRRAA